MDVKRTYQNIDIFQTQKINDTLSNILLIWSLKNREVSYKQGMNEILAVLIISLYPYYTSQSSARYHEVINSLSIYTNNCLIGEDLISDVYSILFDENEFEGDMFFLFEQIMDSGMRDLYFLPLESRPKNDSAIYIVR